MTEHKLSPEAIKIISEIKLISIDSIFENKMPGVLYGNRTVLEYYNFENEERRILANTNDYIRGVHHDSKTKKTHYDGGNKHIICLENNSEQERQGLTLSINCFNNLILDAGSYGLFNTETNEELISEKSLDDKKIDYIYSLDCFNNSLYALVTNYDNSHSVVAINTSNPNNFSIEETIKKYKLKHTRICDFTIIPQKSFKGDNGKNYPFSIITCTYEQYLDLNKKKIKGTKIKNLPNQSIKRLKLIKSTNTTAEIIYSGQNLNAIYKADIDLTNNTATTKKIITNLTDYVYALQPIFNKDSHKHLLELGEVIKK
ncbi:MAG: hypothetical protein ABIC91_05655 [Nanoarchaeota archaeon]|nr:hypothetical protein [Nanoarchaeota archaeon]MBU1030571.1 hypothetical protein [Nanoarchaeota archaeon]MBU1849375.1 hypothetical protein [Nanoarchaeota archaeon]